MIVIAIPMLILSVIFMMLLLIRIVVMIRYSDILSDTTLVSALKDKPLVRGGILWMPLDFIRDVVYWPMRFGCVRTVREQKAALTEQLKTHANFLRSVGAPPSPHKGWFYTLVRLVFWYRLLSIQVRDIRAIKMLESTLKK